MKGGVKSGKRISQRGGRAARPQVQPRQLAHPGFDQESLRRQTYLTVPEAAAYLRFSTPRAMWTWAERHRIRKGRRGKTILFKRTTLDEAINQSAVK